MSEHTGADQRSAEQDRPTTTEVARGEAVGVGCSIEEAGEQVARTATRQASDVTSETARQARQLRDDGVGQLWQQARDGQHKAAVGVRGLADQLREMAKHGGESGIASDLVQQASDQAHGLASWLERRDPGELLEEVRGFARRRPGAFLLGAAVAGVATGRLTRGAVDTRTATTAHGDGGSSQPPAQPPPEPPPQAPARSSAPAPAPVAAQVAASSEAPGRPAQPHRGADGPVSRPGSAPRPARAETDDAEPAAWDPATDPPLDRRP